MILMTNCEPNIYIIYMCYKVYIVIWLLIIYILWSEYIFSLHFINYKILLNNKRLDLSVCSIFSLFVTYKTHAHKSKETQATTPYTQRK